MYEIKTAGSKGFGVFAKHLIPKGTRILAERPIFTVKADRDILPAFQKISAAKRTYIGALSIHSRPGPPLLSWSEALWHVARAAVKPRIGFPSSIAEYKNFLAAFRNNSFDIGNGVRAIFRETSRFNHACVPTAQGNFNATVGRFTIHALQAIAPGDEISISYLDEHGASRATRQARLETGYGFECGCAVCDLHSSRGQESERNRTEVRKSLARFAEESSSDEERAEGEIEMLGDLIKMFEGEGLAGRELGTMYLAAAEGYAKKGDMKVAKEYAARGLEIESICLGKDSPLYMGSLERVRKISSISTDR